MEFYKENDFQKTEIGMIPSDWEVKKIIDISKDLISGGTPSTKKENYWNGEIPWMTSEHIDGRMITKGQRNISKEGLDKSASNLVPGDNLLVATRVGIGKAALNKISIAISQDLTGVILNKEKATPDFLFWFLSNNERKLISIAQGSTIKGILREDLGKFRIALPRIEEQRQIALILSRIDDAIQKTDEIIQKTQLLKNGLMQELLTKGVGHKEFKFSEELGSEIPKEWGVKTIDQLFYVKTGTTPSTKKEKYWNYGNITWLTPDDLSKLNGRIYIKKGKREITDIALKEYNLNLMPERSIIISSRAPVGYVAILLKQATFNQGCKGLIPKDLNIINPEFYSYFLISKRDLLNIKSGGSTFRELSKKMLEDFFVPFPKFEEQRQIASVLSKVDEQIGKERQTKEQFEKLKKGLMQILLTGKVRIRVN